MRKTLKTGGRRSVEVARTLARPAVGRAGIAHAAATHVAEALERKGDERDELTDVSLPSFSCTSCAATSAEEQRKLVQKASAASASNLAASGIRRKSSLYGN